MIKISECSVININKRATGSLRYFADGGRPYGQPGPLPNGSLTLLIDWVKSPDFISWLLTNLCASEDADL